MSYRYQETSLKMSLQVKMTIFTKHDKRANKNPGKNNNKTHTHAYLQTIIKTAMKFQKDQSKAIGGVAISRYLLPVHCCTRFSKGPQKWLFRASWKHLWSSKMISQKLLEDLRSQGTYTHSLYPFLNKMRNFRNFKRAIAYLQTIIKTLVKFQKDQSKLLDLHL